MVDYEKIIDVLLENRGIGADADKDIFLNPNYESGLNDPFLMKDMDKSVVRILDAINANESIMIYSDFDADGIPAGVLLRDFFSKIGYENFDNYIPHRDMEGYGLHKEAIDGFAKEGIDLIITVDVGIVGNEAVDLANELGIDVIVTDHHEPSNDIPNALAVLNPKQKKCNYPFSELCGTGIAYKLVQAIIAFVKSGKYEKNKDNKFVKNITDIKDGWEKWLLDLVAIATIADMVPLIGENRILSYWGLRVLKKTRRVGLIALLNKLRINLTHIDENDIGFSIAPRINASSRMGHPKDAFDLLCSSDIKESEMLASKLDGLNNKRKASVAAIVRALNVKIEKRKSLNDGNLPDILVFGDTDWSPALVGLAAGSVADKMNKIVCVWGREGTGVLKGSCRNGLNPDVNIVDMFTNAEEQLLFFGGHNAAGGFAISDENIHVIEHVFNDNFGKILKKKISGNLNEDYTYDIDVRVSDITDELVRSIRKLAPFGIGNSKPIFRLFDIKISHIRHFGKENNHIEIGVVDVNTKKVLKVTKFFAKDDSFSRKIEIGDDIIMLINIEYNTFAGRRGIVARIVDIV